MLEAGERCLNARWANDCQGKKDYDGEILSISTRYWPAGGHALIVSNTPAGVTMEQESNGRPASATSSLMLRVKSEFADDTEGDYLQFATQDFEGETFEAVAAQVEEWAQQQMDRAVAALTAEFGTPKEWI